MYYQKLIPFFCDQWFLPAFSKQFSTLLPSKCPQDCHFFLEILEISYSLIIVTLILRNSILLFTSDGNN